MSGNRNINMLRDILFDSLEKLLENKISIDKANAVSRLGDSIISTAKVEVAYIAATKSKGTGFLDSSTIKQTETGTKQITGNVTTHKMRG